MSVAAGRSPAASPEILYLIRAFIASLFQKETDVNSQLRTVEQAATDLCVSVHTIRAWIAQRKIGCVRLGRAIRIPTAEITRLIERGTVPALNDNGRSAR